MTCRPAEPMVIAAVAAVFEKQIDCRGSRADADARNGRARGEGVITGGADDKPRKAKAENELADGLNDLTDCCGRHVALSLEQPAAGGDNTDAQHRRPEGEDRVGCTGNAHNRACEQIRQEHHCTRAQQADGKISNECGVVDALHLTPVAQRPRLGDHAAHGYGQTGGRDDKQHGVDIVGGGEIGVAIFADQLLQRNFIEHSDDLDDDRREGQNRRTGQIVLLFSVLILQSQPSFFPPNIRGMTYSASSRTTASRSMVVNFPAE